MAYQYGAPGGYDNTQQSYNPGNSRQGGGAGGYGMQSFQAPSNMPNFNAPVIRMGVDGQGYDQRGPQDGRGGRYDNRGRAGLGADQRDGRAIERERQQMRDNMAAQQPPTREEVARTIFIGNLGETAPPDEVLELVLRCAGKLRRWTRAKDANDKKCRFGFAEYTDAESLETAKELFGEGIEVPAYKDGKILMEEEDDKKPQLTKLLVVIDEQSSAYIDEWQGKKADNEDAKAFRVEGAQEDLRQCVSSLTNANAFAANAFDQDGDVAMYAGPNGADSEAQELGGDDELVDIPEAMRPVVKQEIKNFRERSNRRDQERARQEEEFEAAQSGRANRLASPPPSGAPSGPANGTRSGVMGAPAGPRGYRGVQLPSDYVNGVAFVNGNLPPEDESDASDIELENRRQAAKVEEQEKQYLDAERRWLNRERQRTAAQERERTRDEAEARDRERHKEATARKYSSWNDDEEERTEREEYYYDRAAWARKRGAQREREVREDERDRQMEEREKEDERRREDESRGAADRFLAETGAELAAKQPEQSGPAFKISLGGAANRNRLSKPANNAATMLEDEEDAAESKQRRPIRTLPVADANATSNIGSDLSDAERAAARQALAAEIPMDSEALFGWEVRWSYIRPELIDREIRPFVEKKTVEYLGVQEDFLVDLVINCLKEQKPAAELVSLLETVLEDEAEVFARKVWRLVVFFGEAEGRGLV